jgi:hypothetical protein
VVPSSLPDEDSVVVDDELLEANFEEAPVSPPPPSDDDDDEEHKTVTVPITEPEDDLETRSRCAKKGCSRRRMGVGSSRFCDVCRPMCAICKTKWAIKNSPYCRHCSTHQRNVALPAGMEDKRARRWKDPNAPKKARCPFILYAEAKRPEVRLLNPGISFGMLAKVLAQNWKSVNEDVKKKYIDLAEADKRRYANELNEYKKANCLV